jgi:hypothetical protein
MYAAFLVVMKIVHSIVVLSLMSLLSYNVQAQNLWNDANGRIINSTTGVIRLRGAQAELRNTNASVSALANTGVLELLGERPRFTATNNPTSVPPDNLSFGSTHQRRIGGLVRYAANTERQFVQGRFYTNLELSGSATKSVLDGVRVGGDTLAVSSNLSNSGVPLSLGSGVYLVSGGARLYSGTFVYDNALTQTLVGGEDYDNLEVQRGVGTLFAGTSIPLHPKIIPAGTTVQTRGTFRQSGDTLMSSALGAVPANRSGVQILGVLRVGTRAEFPAGGGDVSVGRFAVPSTATQSLQSALVLGSDTARFAVRRLLINEGRITSSSSATQPTVWIIASTCTLRLSSAANGSIAASASVQGELELHANQLLVIAGALENQRTDRLNVRFHPQSTVQYGTSEAFAGQEGMQSVAQPIMTSARARPYGNLVLIGNAFGGAKVIDLVQAGESATPVLPTEPQHTPPVTTITIAGSLQLSRATLDVTANASAQSVNGEVVMLTPSATVMMNGFVAPMDATSRAANLRMLPEIRGAMVRLLDSATRTYFYHNAQTRITFTQGVPPREMRFDIRGGVQPSNYQAPSDVRRSIVWSWQPVFEALPTSDSRDWTATLRLGYSSSNVAMPFRADNERRLALYESVPTLITSPPVSGSSAAQESVRILGARSLTRQAAPPNPALGQPVPTPEWGWVEASGLQAAPLQGVQAMDTVATNRFVSGREILLRGETPVVRSVRHGRWSNPATWNIGREPEPGDVVEVLHVVHIGFRRTMVDGATNDGNRRERALQALSDSTRVLSSSLRIRSEGALLIGFVSANESGAEDERPPERSWWLSSGSVRVESGAPTTNQIERITRDGLVAADGARSNARVDFRGLFLYQPAAGSPRTAVKMPSLVNLGTIFNGADIDITDE